MLKYNFNHYKMNSRLVLIKDIEKFCKESIINHNCSYTINKAEYFDLLHRIDNLKEEDFDNAEKQSYFLRYLNQSENKVRRFMLEGAFEGNRLSIGAYLQLSNYMIRAVDWLK